MVDKTTTLTPEQQTAADDQTIANSPSQGEVDVANANAAAPNATDADKEKAIILSKKKAKADKIKAKRASAAQAEADKDAGKPCNIDTATSKQAASCEKLKESNADFKECCDKAKAASDKVKCQKAKMNYVKPPPPKKGEKASPPPSTKDCPAPTEDGSKKVLLDAKQKKKTSENNLEKAENDISNAEDKIKDLQGDMDDIDEDTKDIQSKINDLSSDQSDAAKKEIKSLEAKITALKAKKAELKLQQDAAKTNKKTAEAVKKEEEANLESGVYDKDIEEAKEQAELDEEELERLEKEAEKAAEACDDMKEDLADKYPNTFGKNVKAHDAAVQEKENCIQEKEDAGKEPLSLSDIALPALGVITATGAAAAVAGLFDSSDSFSNFSGATGSPPPPGEEGVFLHWDAPATKDAEGVLENLVADHLQPIYKHSFIGEFPDKISGLDWLVKTMDRPKIDVEYVEQIRNNVKRQYPVKYNFGDLSMTFMDDANHKTILTLHKYFSTDVWDHGSISGYGKFRMRDSVVIPEIKIYDLTVETGNHLRYTYKNVSLVSLDYDAPDEAEDGAVHTIQAVFKIEGFEVEESKSPPTLNTGNAPVWV